MPELPEVETIVRTLKPKLLNKTIINIQVLNSKSLQVGSESLGLLFGARVINVLRRGKLLFLQLGLKDDSFVISEQEEIENRFGLWHKHWFLVFHLKMTGRLLFKENSILFEDKHNRLVFTLNEGSLFFSDIRKFGYCRIVAPGDLLLWDFWQKLGPEPLLITEQEFTDCFKDKKGSFKASKIKSLLLDQKTVAGVGNIYADEALFKAGIHPASLGTKLSNMNYALLYKELKAILLKSIQECGSSIKDYIDADGKAGAFQNLFRVYGRSDQACFICGTKLEKCKVASRTSVFCAKCQTLHV